jgi:hypothetical protein
MADLINFFGLSFGDCTQQNLCKSRHWILIHRHSSHAGNVRALGVDCYRAPDVDFVQGPSCF